MNEFEVLCGLEPFDTMSQENRALLIRGARIKEYRRGEVPLNRGEAVAGACVVISGRLRVYVKTPEGEETTVCELHQGDCCGLSLNCLFNDLLYPAWVRAEEETVIALIPSRTYFQLFQRETTIQSLTMRTLSNLVFRMMHALEPVRKSSHRQRLADFILTHASSEGVLWTTQHHLGEQLGATRETIAKWMRDLAQAGLVRQLRGRILILDVAGLRGEVGTPAKQQMQVWSEDLMEMAA